MMLTLLSAFGSAGSILGLLVSLYVLWREDRIEDEVLDLTKKEATRHDK
jgi:hypothetical protein